MPTTWGSFCRPTDAGLAGGLAGLGPCARVSTDGRAAYAQALPGLGAAAHNAGRYGNTRADLFAAPQPFWDYWERRASMSTVV